MWPRRAPEGQAADLAPAEEEDEASWEREPAGDADAEAAAAALVAHFRAARRFEENAALRREHALLAAQLRAVHAHLQQQAAAAAEAAEAAAAQAERRQAKTQTHQQVKPAQSRCGLCPPRRAAR